MKQVDDIISRLNKKFKSLYSDFNGLYLYGSYANNMANENSDIDLVAVFDNTPERDKRMNLWKIIGKFEAEFDVILDFHPTTYDDLKRNPIYYNQVINKGIYYEAE